MKYIKGNVNSHIQVPKSVLEGFSFSKQVKNEKGFFEKHKMVFQMDMDGNICEKDIKAANTQFGYFEDFIEKDVLAVIETAFGNIKAKAIQLIKNIDSKKSINVHISADEILAVKKYCALCYVRSENFVKEVQQNSIMQDFIVNEPQNSTIYTYLRYPQVVDYLFYPLSLFILKNISIKNLLLPQCGMVMRQNGKTQAMSAYIPISEKVCFLLALENKSGFVSTMDEKCVENLNKFSIKTEYNYNHRAIYAKNKTDLEDYKDYILSLRKKN